MDHDGQLVLRCVADARPPNVTYYWYHNGKPLTAVTDATLHFRLDRSEYIKASHA